MIRNDVRVTTRVLLSELWFFEQGASELTFHVSVVRHRGWTSLLTLSSWRVQMAVASRRTSWMTVTSRWTPMRVAMTSWTSVGVTVPSRRSVRVAMTCWTPVWVAMAPTVRVIVMKGKNSNKIHTQASNRNNLQENKSIDESISQSINQWYR